MEPQVILVDEKDNQIGVEGKMKAHQNGGKLHRAISVFAFNRKGETMLQRRAATKYHAKSQWANTCCSHPAPGESPIEAGHRRLEEELGFDCPLREIFVFTYHADVGSDLTENEVDHILFGNYDGKPNLNPEEVSEVRWISLKDLQSEIKKDKKSFAPWLVLMIGEVIAHSEVL